MASAWCLSRKGRRTVSLTQASADVGVEKLDNNNEDPDKINTVESGQDFQYLMQAQAEDGGKGTYKHDDQSSDNTADGSTLYSKNGQLTRQATQNMNVTIDSGLN